MIAQAHWMKDIVAKWRKELRLKLESMAMRNIVAEARNPMSKNKYAASKTIIDQINKSKPTRGRPTKAEVQGELKRQTHIERQLQADLRRVLKEDVEES